MRQSLTNSEKNTYRAHPQVSNYYIACHQPRIIWAGSVNALPDTFPASAIVASNTLQGNLSDVQKGMTARIGTNVGQYDLGKIRIRATPTSASLIHLGEFGSGITRWNNAMLTIVEEYAPWSIHPSFDTTTSAWRVDLDPYTSQTVNFGPLALLGPPAIAWLDGATGAACYVGDRSLTNTGGVSITSQSWAFPNGQTVSSALGSSLTPVIITYTNASSGGRYHSLTVTDSNGASHQGHRLTFAFNASNAQPARVFIEEIAGGLNSGGYDGRIEVYGSATSSNFPDGAQIVIFERASYNGIASSLGGNAFGRNNIILVGWIVDDSTRIEPFTGAVSFRIATIDRVLSMTDAYDMFLESGSAASAWDMASGLTIDKATLALVKYRSTIGNITDFNFAGDTASAQELAFRSLPQSSLWEQLRYNYEGVLGLLASDMQSSIYATLDKQVTGASGTLPIITDIAAEDRRDRVTLDHEHFDANSQQVIYAVQGGIYTPIGGISPSHRTAHFGGRQEVARNLTAPNTDTAITWAGNYRAKQNNPYKRVNIPLSGNLRLDPVPQSRITMSLSPTGATNLRGLNWNNQSLIPTDIRVAYNPQSRLPEIDITAETTVDGHGGSSIDFPPSITPLPTPVPTPIPPPGGGGGQGNVMIGIAIGTSADFVVETGNFLDASPTWENITGNLTGSGFGFFVLRRDPYDHKNKAVLLTSGGIYYTTNLTASPPTWNLSLSLAAMRTLVGNASAAFNNVMQMSIAGQGYIGALSSVLSGDPLLAWYLYTSDYTSGTWSKNAVTPMSGLIFDSGFLPVQGLAVSQNNTQRAYVSIGGVTGTIGDGFKSRVHYTDDNGGTWSSADLESIAGYLRTNGAVLFLPYTNNSNDQLIFAGTPGAAASGEAAVWRSTSGISGTWTRINPSIGTDYGHGPATQEGFTESPSQAGGTGLYLAAVTGQGGGSKLYRYNSLTWDEIKVGAAGDFYGYGFGGWPYNNLQMQMFDAGLGNAKVSRSIDGGYNWIDATGNLATLVSGLSQMRYLVPVW